MPGALVITTPGPDVFIRSRADCGCASTGRYPSRSSTAHRNFWTIGASTIRIGHSEERRTSFEADPEMLFSSVMAPPLCAATEAPTIPPNGSANGTKCGCYPCVLRISPTKDRTTGLKQDWPVLSGAFDCEWGRAGRSVPSHRRSSRLEYTNRRSSRA